MLLSLLLSLQLILSITCQLSCYDCPLQANVFNSIITANTLPADLSHCSLTAEQTECSMRVTWTQNPDQTMIMLLAGGDRRVDSGRHNLKNTITLSNNGTHLQWTKSLAYICSTNQCNSLATLKRLLRSLKSEDKFDTLASLLEINTEFHGSLCSFAANTSSYCETEMNQTTCRQCATQEYTQSQSVEVCSNCVDDAVIENFVTREVKFFVNERKHHELWMIECQTKGCNAVETGDLIRTNSDIDFNFELFLNGSAKLANQSFVNYAVLFFMIISLKLFR